MATLTDIGQLITKDPHSNRPVIAGTRTSVRRIAGLYNQGNNAEEIARRLNHLTITQIYIVFESDHCEIGIDRFYDLLYLRSDRC